MLTAAKWCTRSARSAPRVLRGLRTNAVRSFSATAAPKKSSTAIKIAKYTLGATAILTGVGSAHIYSDEGYRRAAYVTYEAVRLSTVYGLHDYFNSSKTDEEKVTLKKELHKREALRVLDVVLGLGGYYIKIAQTVVGTGYVPDEYEEVLGILLDKCPHKPWPVMKAVLEEEIGCPVDEAFSSFDEEPLGAASIGQVHLATLKAGGAPVVVKLQYPEVERYFRIDFDVLTLLFTMFDLGIDQKNVQEMMDGLAASFEAEFDYKLEGNYLRQCSENIMPRFGNQVFIPLPVDAAHPQSPPGRSLCTKKVLTMEKVPGIPIKKHLMYMLEDYAKSQGKTVAQVKEDMKAEFEDPEKLKVLLSAEPTSELVADIGIAAYEATNWLTDTFGWIFGYGSTAGSDDKAGRERAAPLNGPRTIKLLCDVHAHELFEDGVYNSDPHPGNVIMMPDRRLGLIDYGACATMSEEHREGFAKLLVAIAEKDDDKTIEAMKEFGITSTKNDRKYLLTYALVMFHRGFHPDDMYKRCGIPEDVSPMDLDQYLAKLDTLEKFPAHVVPVQRCVAVLLGVAQSIGAGSISIAQMWEKPAREFLKKRKENKAREA